MRTKTWTQRIKKLGKTVAEDIRGVFGDLPPEIAARTDEMDRIIEEASASNAVPADVLRRLVAFQAKWQSPVLPWRCYKMGSSEPLLTQVQVRRLAIIVPNVPENWINPPPERKGFLRR